MCGSVVWVWDAATGERVAKYVDPELIDPEALHVRASVLTMHRVTRDVNSTKNHRPDLIEAKEARLPP